VASIMFIPDRSFVTMITPQGLAGCHYARLE